MTVEEAAELEVLGAIVSAATEDWLASGPVRSSDISISMSLSGPLHDQKRKKKRALLSAQCEQATKWTKSVTLPSKIPPPHPRPLCAKEYSKSKCYCQCMPTLFSLIWLSLTVIVTERSNPFFPQYTIDSDVVTPNQVWLILGQKFRRYSRNRTRNSHILAI